MPAKCSNVDLLLPEGKKLLCAGWTILKLFSAVMVLDYAAGKELQKEKLYILFSKFNWDMVLLLNNQEYIMEYIALTQSW